MKKNIYYKSIFYVVLLVVYSSLAYLFLSSGFNTRTKIKVDYEDSSNIYYKVNYIDNDYSKIDSDKYVSDMVNDIEFNYNYEEILSEYISGYYKYNVEGYLVANDRDTNDSLWERKYNLLEEETVIIDESNVNSIKIEDSFKVDFKKYRDEINSFIKDYGIDIDGYLHIRINIMEYMNFDSLDNEYVDNKVIIIDIPLSSDVFKIDVNNIKNSDSYYEFSSNRPMNMIFLIIGTFCLALSISSIIMIIRQFKVIYGMQNKYNRELKRILSRYDECIVRIKRFYVRKKYNMIYVDSFKELLDVYDKRNKMISFKEVKRGSEAVFVLIDEDTAWIYRLISENL